MRLTRVLLAILSLVLVMTLQACKKRGTATAQCGEIENFESRLGVVNVPQMSLGQLFAVNRQTKSARPLGRVTFQPSQVEHHPKVSSLTVSFDSKLNITFDGDIPLAAQVTLSTAINKSTELAATDLQRQSLHRIIELLDSDEPAKKRVANHLAHNPDDEIHVVHAVQEVSGLKLAVAGGSSTSANVSVIAYGDYELRVTYDCSNVLELSGNAVPAFFKSAPVGFDTGNFYFESTKEVSLRDINLTAVLQ